MTEYFFGRNLSLANQGWLFKVFHLCYFFRYLPHINATDGGHARAAAERQAINSTVQGSAADLVKKAMVDIERKLSEAFPESRNPIRFRKSGPATNFCQEGAFLLLQLHDELIFEASFRTCFWCLLKLSLFVVSWLLVVSWSIFLCLRAVVVAWG